MIQSTGGSLVRARPPDTEPEPVGRTGVTVADAHLGATIQSAPADQITVISSAPSDMRIVAGDKPVTIAAI